MKNKKWTMWMRDKGTFGIAHLLKETKGDTDYTICGMEYSHNALKKTDGVALMFTCNDCDKGEYNPTDLRSSKALPNNFTAPAPELTDQEGRER